jgi:hypothetical protein
VEYPLPICEAIIDCILNDEDTQDALAYYLGNNDKALRAIQGLIDNGSLITNPNGTLVSAESDDALFGACTYLIDTMHDAIVDFNQLAEVGTNLRERANIILQAIPGFGDAIAAIPEYVDELFTDVIEVFEAQYTTTPITGSRDRLRCGVFCLAKANARTLSWQMILDYMWGLVSFESTIPNLALDFVGFLATGSWAGQDVVNISFANMATALNIGQKFGSQTFPNLATIIKLGLNDPDSDWTTVCEDCPAAELLCNTQTCLYAGQDTGFNVTMGVDYTFTATGTFIYDATTGSSCGPEGIPPNPFTAGVEPSLKCLILMAKIGVGGSYFAVGDNLTFTASDTGTIFLSVNELYSASINTYADNSGTLHVTVS